MPPQGHFAPPGSSDMPPQGPGNPDDNTNSGNEGSDLSLHPGQQGGGYNNQGSMGGMGFMGYAGPPQAPVRVSVIEMRKNRIINMVSLHKSSLQSL